ncbi:hypothetical protein [Sinorhizobium fredii]|uniref:hypothetical protein n=1 Tax=Rhizobium fredii TaxID=380 RepID=UPI003518B9E5
MTGPVEVIFPEMALSHSARTFAFSLFALESNSDNDVEAPFGAMNRHALGALYSPEKEYQSIFPISGATTPKLKGEV